MVDLLALWKPPQGCCGYRPEGICARKMQLCAYQNSGAKLVDDFEHGAWGLAAHTEVTRSAVCLNLQVQASVWARVTGAEVCWQPFLDHSVGEAIEFLQGAVQERRTSLPHHSACPSGQKDSKPHWQYDDVPTQ